MRVLFHPTTVPMDCEPLDPDEGPVLLKLTSKGDLVFHNWDSDSDEVLEALGLHEETSLCYRIHKNSSPILWFAINESSLFKSGIGSLVPQEIMKQLLKTGKRLKKAATRAFDKTNYRSSSTKWVDSAGTTFKIEFMILGASQKNAEFTSVEGLPETVWHSKYGKRQYPGKTLEVKIKTSPKLYIELLNKIPDGVIYDPKKDIWCLAAAIIEIIERNSMIVIAGQQGRGLSINRRAALVNKDEDGDWFVKRWL